MNGSGQSHRGSSGETRKKDKKAEIRKKQVLIVVVCTVIGGLILLRDHQEAARIVEKGIPRGEAGSPEELQEFSYETEDGQTGLVSVEVSGEVLTEKEAEVLLDDAREEWESVFLGENESVNAVSRDLVLPETAADGLVSVSYRFDNYEYIDAQGRVAEELPEEGALTELTAEFSYGEYSLLDIRMLRLVPRILTPEEETDRQIRKAVAEAEATSRENSSFQLPGTVAGQRIRWKKEIGKGGFLILLAGILGAAAYGRRDKEAQKKQQKERRQQLLLEYPHMVEQFSMLLGSGMTVPGAWEQVVVTGRRLNKTGQYLYLDEMQLTLREMREGSGTEECLERFGSRIGLTEYRRFASILTQNLKKGTKDVEQQLETEAAGALEARRTNAKRLGEEAGTKLLGPMMCMFVIVLTVVLIPALRSF